MLNVFKETNVTLLLLVCSHEGYVYNQDASGSCCLCAELHIYNISSNSLQQGISHSVTNQRNVTKPMKKVQYPETLDAFSPRSHKNDMGAQTPVLVKHDNPRLRAIICFHSSGFSLSTRFWNLAAGTCSH